MTRSGNEHDWQTADTDLNLIYTMEYWLGVVDGILKCSHCQSYAAIRLLDWRDSNLETRVFSVAILPAETARVFLRNMASDYCDLARKGHEVEALKSALQTESQIVALQLPDLKILASVPAGAYLPLKYPDWRNLTSESGSTGWFRQLGLER